MNCWNELGASKQQQQHMKNSTRKWQFVRDWMCIVYGFSLSFFIGWEWCRRKSRRNVEENLLWLYITQIHLIEYIFSALKANVRESERDETQKMVVKIAQPLNDDNVDETCEHFARWNDKTRSRTVEKDEKKTRRCECWQTDRVGKLRWRWTSFLLTAKESSLFAIVCICAKAETFHYKPWRFFSGYKSA